MPMKLYSTFKHAWLQPDRTSRQQQIMTAADRRVEVRVERWTGNCQPHAYNMSQATGSSLYYHSHIQGSPHYEGHAMLIPAASYCPRYKLCVQWFEDMRTWRLSISTCMGFFWGKSWISACAGFIWCKSRISACASFIQCKSWTGSQLHSVQALNWQVTSIFQIQNDPFFSPPPPLFLLKWNFGSNQNSQKLKYTAEPAMNSVQFSLDQDGTEIP